MQTNTLGELYDRLEVLREGYQAVAEAKQALGFGGNEVTMAYKRSWLWDCEERLQELRNEPL